MLSTFLLVCLFNTEKLFFMLRFVLYHMCMSTQQCPETALKATSLYVSVTGMLLAHKLFHGSVLVITGCSCKFTLSVQQ